MAEIAGGFSSVGQGIFLVRCFRNHFKDQSKTGWVLFILSGTELFDFPIDCSEIANGNSAFSNVITVLKVAHLLSYCA